jgi:hypothetical protein
VSCSTWDSFFLLDSYVTFLLHCAEDISWVCKGGKAEFLVYMFIHWRRNLDESNLLSLLGWKGGISSIYIYSLKKKFRWVKQIYRWKLNRLKSYKCILQAWFGLLVHTMVFLYLNYVYKLLFWFFIYFLCYFHFIF